MKDIVIIGSGGLAKEIAFLINDINRRSKEWNILGFIENKGGNIGQINGKYAVHNTDTWLINYPENLSIAFGIGDPKLVKNLSELFKVNSNLNFPNLIHPNVIGDWDLIDMGRGNIICSGNIFTTGIQIGSFNIFNLSCTVTHDCKIGNYNVINPNVNISGNVSLENEILVGTGAQILQNNHVCSGSTIGAGSLVTTSIDKSGTYFGVPARLLK